MAGDANRSTRGRTNECECGGLAKLGDEKRSHKIKTREGANGTGRWARIFLLARRVVMMANAWKTGTAVTVWTRVPLPPGLCIHQNCKTDALLRKSNLFFSHSKGIDALSVSVKQKELQISIVFSSAGKYKFNDHVLGSCSIP